MTDFDSTLVTSTSLWLLFLSFDFHFHRHCCGCRCCNAFFFLLLYHQSGHQFDWYFCLFSFSLVHWCHDVCFRYLFSVVDFGHLFFCLSLSEIVHRWNCLYVGVETSNILLQVGLCHAPYNVGIVWLRFFVTWHASLMWFLLSVTWIIMFVMTCPQQSFMKITVSWFLCVISRAVSEKFS